MTRAAVTGLFRAFSDQNRLRILHVLRVPQARVSRHLAHLRRARLVRVRRSGLWMHYSLAPARGAVHRTLLGCLGGCFSELPQFAADARRLARIRMRGGCCPT